jgi:hypothetical protein
MGSPQYGPNPANGAYYPAAINGTLFHGGNQAPVTTAMSAGLPTTYTGGLVLANPIASDNNLILQRATAAFSEASPNGAVISVAIGHAPTTNVSGTLTTVPVQNANPANDTNAEGVLYSSASVTLPAAPVVAALLGAVGTAAVSADVTGPPIQADLGGSLILPPGSYAVFASTAALSAHSFMGHFEWVELPAPTPT